jgi:protein O-mannosyl-transferase
VFHPIHVEAVASLVGRADSLCGLFYVAAIIMYTIAVRSNTFDVFTLWFGFALAWAASLSKEIGVTVFGMFVVCEVLHNIGLVQSASAKRQFKASMTQRDINLYIIQSGIYRSLTQWASLVRILLTCACLGATAALRLWLNGDNQLYHWTVLENHIHLLPTFKERALSYAQTHFWYIYKLIFPRYLCFDYGYACLPTVHTWSDWRNVLPLGVYCIVIWLILRGLIRVRISLILGLAWLLVPLVPALNILFPVGTVLAERLLFVPSVGYCLVIAVLITEDMEPLWAYLQGPSERKTLIGFNDRYQESSSQGGSSSSLLSSPSPSKSGSATKRAKSTHTASANKAKSPHKVNSNDY